MKIVVVLCCIMFEMHDVVPHHMCFVVLLCLLVLYCILSYVVLCCAMSCPVVSDCVVLCQVALYCSMSCCALSSHSISVMY